MCTIAQAGRQWPPSCGGIGQICPLPASQPGLSPGYQSGVGRQAGFVGPPAVLIRFGNFLKKSGAAYRPRRGRTGRRAQVRLMAVRLWDSLRPVIMISSCPAVILPAASLNRNPSPTGDSCFTRENPAARQHKGFVLPAGVRVPPRCYLLTCLPKAAAGTPAR